MGRSSIRKGKAWERQLVRWFERIDGTEATRNLNETRDARGGDVHALWRSSRSDEPIYLIVEAKHHKDPTPWTALRQAEEGARNFRSENASESFGEWDGPDAVAVAIVKETHGETEVWMGMEAFWFLTRQSFEYSFEVEARKHRTRDELAIVMKPGQLAKLMGREWFGP
jgi:hypothetical protein